MTLNFSLFGKVCIIYENRWILWGLCDIWTLGVIHKQILNDHPKSICQPETSYAGGNARLPKKPSVQEKAHRSHETATLSFNFVVIYII